MPPLIPGGNRKGGGGGVAAKHGPDAAGARGTPHSWSFGWLSLSHLPSCMPSSQPLLGPPTPRPATGLAADICGSELHISSMKSPLSLPL